MCGGVVSVLSVGVTQLGRAKRAQSVWLTLAYNAGRVASYAVAGAAAGAFGALVDRIPGVRGAELGLRLGAGLFMVGLGLYLAGAWQRFAVVERVGLPVWRRLEPLARRLLPVRDASTALALGALWGWMPCGLVYAALGLALNAGSAGGGALAMVAFGLGTLPMLMTMGALAARIAVFLRVRWVRRTAGAVIVLFGLLHVAAATAQMARGPASHACCAGRREV
jgi:sulfite exporter TauE/SafE